MKLFKHNPNLTANIGFICYTPFHYYVFKNIYKHLSNSEFIVGDLYGSLNRSEEKKRIAKLAIFLDRKKVNWRYIDHFDKESLSEEYAKYGLLASCLHKGALKERYTNGAKKVRVLYGSAKDKWNFGPWNAFFDVVLTLGPYSQKKLIVYGNAKMVGNPKFDDWFTNPFDTESILESKKKFDKNKKTILFVPTYGILSSQSLMLPILTKCSEKYNVIVKFHHNTLLYEKRVVAAYKKSQVHIRTDEDDILTLFKISDIVISDNSGAIFDALFADLPIICINNTQLKILNNSSEIGMFYDKNKTHFGSATNNNSLEQRIKMPAHAIGPILTIDETYLSLPFQKKSEQLMRVLKQAEINRSAFSSQREKLRRELFVNYKDAGNRAAMNISKLLYNKKPLKNLLSQSIIGYTEYIIDQQKKIDEMAYSEKNKRNVLSFYNRIRSLPFLNRLIFVLKEFF